ncbi:MAG: LPS export ABC transporter permease LptF [Gammaproteobacteria bacterium]
MILRRYLVREIAQAFGAVLVILILIYVSDQFVRFLGEAAAGRIAAELIAQFIALKLATQVALLLPLAFYLATLLAFGRLYRDSEMVAMLASGVGPLTLLKTVLGVAAAVAVIATVVSLYVAPQAESQLHQLREQTKGQSGAALIHPGRFKEFNYGAQVLYVQEATHRSQDVRGVFARLRWEAGEDIVVAERAYQHVDEVTGNAFIVLVNGHRYQGTPGEGNYVVTRFGRYGVRIDPSHEEQGHPRVQALPSQALLEFHDVNQILELARRLSLPVSVLVLGALAVPLAHTTPRRGRFAKLLPATLIYFIYFNLLSIVENLVLHGRLPVSIGVWVVHGMVTLVAVALLVYRSSASRWLWRVSRKLKVAT